MFKFEKHTADIKIRFEVDEFSQIFQEAINALNEYLTPRFKDEKERIIEINIESISLETLVVDFLNEIIGLLQIEKFLPQTIEIKEQNFFGQQKDNQNDLFFLKGKLKGKTYDKIYKDIKAATYHNLNLLKNKDNKLILEVVLDI